MKELLFVRPKAGRNDDSVDNRRLEDQRVYNLSLRGDHLIANKIKLNWMAAYARASEQRPDERYIEYETVKILLG